MNVESFHKTKLAFKRNRKETNMLDVDVFKKWNEFLYTYIDIFR